MKFNLSQRNLTNQTNLEELHAQRIRLLGPVIGWMVILMTAGILGNALVCYVHGRKIQRSTANNFILWLAALDLFTCCIGMPMELYDIVHTFDNPPLCKTIRFTIYLSVMTSVATLVFIAMDRYWKICRPLKVSPIRRCRIVILISLLVGLGLAWPSLVLFGHKKMPAYSGIYAYDCSIDATVSGTVYPSIYFVILGIAFLSGAIVLILLYVIIGRKLYRRIRHSIGEDVALASFNSRISNSAKGVEPVPRRQGILRSGFSRKGKKGDSRYNVTRTSLIFFTISLVFVLSFLPSLALMTTSTLYSSFIQHLSDGQFVAFSFFLRTYFINNCVNPIIYGFLNRIFRKECIKLLRNLRSVCHKSRSESFNQSDRMNSHYRTKGPLISHRNRIL